MKMNKKEIELLDTIINNPYQVGPFSGMIFNASVSNPHMTIEELTQQALKVRLTLKELVQ